MTPCPSPLKSARLDAAPGIVHGFFGRTGGVSTGIYRGLNCGFGSDDSQDCVRENRTRAAAALALPADRLLTLYQVHSPDVVIVEAPWAFEAAPRADAAVTAQPGLALGVLAADCVPVLFADPTARVIGAAHAGWRGALAGVLEATLGAMERLGARPESVRAAIGPSIQVESYEVGNDFKGAFLARDAGAAAFFRAPTGKGGKPHFDLPAYVRARLGRSGVRETDWIARDTYANEETLFSFRRATHRGEPDYGRNLSAIALREE